VTLSVSPSCRMQRQGSMWHSWQAGIFVIRGFRVGWRREPPDKTRAPGALACRGRRNRSAAPPRGSRLRHAVFAGGPPHQQPPPPGTSGRLEPKLGGPSRSGGFTPPRHSFAPPRRRPARRAGSASNRRSNRRRRVRNQRFLEALEVEQSVRSRSCSSVTIIIPARPA
jgi:hypothetical protein